MSVEIHPTTPAADGPRAPATDPGDRAGGPHHRRVPGRRRRGRPGAHPGRLRRRHRERHHRLGAHRRSGSAGRCIAVLTARHTNRPQRWAAVPAAAMGATGLALAGPHPRGRRHDPAELGVAAGRAGARGLDVRPDAPLPARAAAAGCSPRSSPPWRSRPSAPPTRTSPCVRDQGTYAAPGTTYDVGGHRLHLDCRGHGGPTVVLFNGLGEISASWARITGPGRRDRPRVRLRPRRPGLERRRRATPRTASTPPRTCTPCWPPPARPAPTSWSGTRPAAPTR